MKWAPATTPVDMRITEQEHIVIANTDDGATDCTDADLPEFWMDMCGYDAPLPGSNKDDIAELEYVNLQLNPERWTGYNGSHVWSAIYEENCLKSSGSVDDMCYEERVLYRLLSGMHASVNIHIALKAKTPKKGVAGREDWSADPGRFAALLRGRRARRLRDPAGAPSPRFTPGNAWGYQTNCKIPLRRSPFGHCVASYVDDPLA